MTAIQLIWMIYLLSWV